MLRFAADENFDRRIVRGLLRRLPNLDLVRSQEADLSGTDDPTVLQWAADQQRVVLTHDVTTMTHYAYERILHGQPMPGIVEVRGDLPIGDAIEDLLLLAEVGKPEDLENQILYIPLK